MRCPPRLPRGDRPPGGHSELGPVPSLEGSPLTTLDTLLEEIRTGPSGPQIAAFFDFDGTLIDGYSAAALYSHRLRTRCSLACAGPSARTSSPSWWSAASEGGQAGPTTTWSSWESGCSSRA